MPEESFKDDHLMETLTEGQLEQFAQQIAVAIAHQRPPRTSWDRRWNVIVTAIAVASFLFTLGMKWNGVDVNKEVLVQQGQRIDRIETDAREMRAEQAKMRSTNDVVNVKLDAIKDQVADIKARFEKAFK